MFLQCTKGRECGGIRAGDLVSARGPGALWRAQNQSRLSQRNTDALAMGCRLAGGKQRYPAQPRGRMTRVRTSLVRGNRQQKPAFHRMGGRAQAAAEGQVPRGARRGSVSSGASAAPATAKANSRRVRAPGHDRPAPGAATIWLRRAAGAPAPAGRRRPGRARAAGGCRARPRGEGLEAEAAG